MDNITSKQFSEWEAYDRLEPIGTWREDYRLAYLCALLTNLTISVHGKQGTKSTNPIDFMLEWDLGKAKEPKKQSLEEMKTVLKGIASHVNKKVEREKHRIDLKNRPPKRFRNTNNPAL